MVYRVELYLVGSEPRTTSIKIQGTVKGKNLGTGLTRHDEVKYSELAYVWEEIFSLSGLERSWDQQPIRSVVNKG